MIDIEQLSSADPDIEERLENLLTRAAKPDPAVTARVEAILADVRTRGDQALVEYSNRLDGMQVADAAALEVGVERLPAALAAIPRQQREALQTAADRLRAYAERQKLTSWSYTEPDGTLLGQQVVPLDRSGCTCPAARRPIRLRC